MCLVALGSNSSFIASVLKTLTAKCMVMTTVLLSVLVKIFLNLDFENCISRVTLNWM